LKKLQATWLLMMLALGFVTPTKAGLNRWTADHPEDGLVFTIVFHPMDPDVVLAGGVDGVYRSTDAGSTWAPFGNGLSGGTVQFLEFHPTDPTIVFAVSGHKLYCSRDEGQNWNAWTFTGDAARASFGWLTVSRSQPTIVWLVDQLNYRVYGLDPVSGQCDPLPLPLNWTEPHWVLAHPSDPDTLYVDGYRRLGRTRDGGATWDEVVTGLDSLILNTLILDCNNPARLYLGTGMGYNQSSKSIWWGGVYRTDNEGDLWTLHNEGLPMSTVTALAIDPADASTLYAGTAGGGLAKSADGGVTWAGLDAGPRIRRIGGVYVSPHDSGLILAGTNDGIIRSEDFGASWASASAGLAGANIDTMAADPAIPGRLYAGTAYGRVYRRDGQDEWQLLGAGFSGDAIGCLAVHPGNPSRLYAGADGGWIYRSDDSGASWRPAMGNFPERDIYRLCPHPTDSDRIDACVSLGIARTVDGGRWWRFVQPSFKPTILAVDPQDPEILLAGSTYGDLYRSDDGGANWTGLLSGDGIKLWDLAFHPLNPSIVYASTPYYKLYWSTDRGVTFQLLAQFDDMSDVLTSLAFDATEPGWLYGTTYARDLVKSTDGGETWTPVVNPLSSGGVYRITADPLLSGVVYALYADGLYRCFGGGTTWEAIPTEFSFQSINTLVVDPTDSQILYVGASNGVYRSPDAGQNWQILTDGMDNCRVNSLLPDPADPDRIMAGTGGSGFMRSDDGGANWTPHNMGLSHWVYEIQFHPRHDGEIWAAHHTGIGTSGDDGDTWNGEYNLLPTTIHQVVFGPNDLVFFFRTADKLYQTVDGGAPVVILNDTKWAIQDAGSLSGLFAVNGNGFQFRADQWSSWETRNSGMEPGTYKFLQHITQNAHAPEIITVSDSYRIHRSATAGLLWRPITAGQAPDAMFARVLPDPHDTDRIYAYGPTGIYTLTIGSKDFNGDGAVDAGDLLWLAGALAGQAGTPGEVYPVADLTIDGRVDVLDLTLLINVLVGNTEW